MALNKVTVMDVRIDVYNKSPVVILRDVESRELFLPIWVGDMEAISIQMALEHKSLERPLTHDLLVNILDTLDVAPRMLKINRIEDQTYFAEMVIERDGGSIAIDCRPSDGIAIALRKGVPIYVENTLLYEIKISDSDSPDGEGGSLGEFDHDQFMDFLKGIQPKDFRGESKDDGS
ncbi:bifunctional nuclease family protein [bacterium]|nr:bifunctional nuclease family protein [bacterium]